jgi:hypothetical protein
MFLNNVSYFPTNISELLMKIKGKSLTLDWLKHSLMIFYGVSLETGPSE